MFHRLSLKGIIEGIVFIVLLQSIIYFYHIVPKPALRPAIHISGGKVRFEPCSVPCFWPDQSGGIISNWHIDELDINIVMSMESEAYYPELKLQKTPLTWYATTRMTSDVPIPYFSWAEYSIQTAPLPYDKTVKAALFMARNCNSRSGREDLVQKLMEYMPVHSVSTCLNNKRVNTNDKHALMRKYALYLAFENSRVDDYITEKLWGAYAAGSIPVYLGAPNIQRFVPSPDSFVDVGAYSTPRSLAAHLNAILSHKNIYDGYHAWRKRPLDQSFKSMYNFTHIHSRCRVCEKAAATLGQ